MPHTLFLRADDYAPDRRQDPHDHDELQISIVLRGGVTETVGATTEWGGALSVVVKDRGVRHANQFGPVGATIARLSVADVGVADLLDDPKRTVEWKWDHRLTAAAHFLRLVGRRRHLTAGIATDDADVVDLLSALTARRVAQPTGRPPAWLVEAVAWLRTQWQPAMRVADVARFAHVHPVYLARCVRRWYGHSVGDELRRLRLRAAAHDVAFRRADLAQVALDSGYSDQAHLCRDFRRTTGVTPGAYRATVDELESVAHSS